MKPQVAPLNKLPVQLRALAVVPDLTGQYGLSRVVPRYPGDTSASGCTTATQENPGVRGFHAPFSHLVTFHCPRPIQRRVENVPRRNTEAVLDIKGGIYFQTDLATGILEQTVFNRLGKNRVQSL